MTMASRIFRVLTIFALTTLIAACGGGGGGTTTLTPVDPVGPPVNPVPDLVIFEGNSTGEGDLKGKVITDANGDEFGVTIADRKLYAFGKGRLVEGHSVELNGDYVVVDDKGKKGKVGFVFIAQESGQGVSAFATASEGEGVAVFGQEDVAGVIKLCDIVLGTGTNGEVTASVTLSDQPVTPDNLDVDGDGKDNTDDNCQLEANVDQKDTDGDGRGDACDASPNGTDDDDLDGVLNGNDNCRADPNPDQADADGDGIGDACDGLNDSDNDGIADDADNCPGISNSSQADFDGDGVGDACDEFTDSDFDGVADSADNCPFLSNADQADDDADGVGNVCDATDDTDSDGDGIPDTVDPCPANPTNPCALITAADTVTVNGTEWAQPDLFLNLSWNTINGVCPAGVCGDNAVLNGWDMSGWTWTTSEDLHVFFNVYLAPEFSLSGSASSVFIPGSDIHGHFSRFFDIDGWRPGFTDLEAIRELTGYVQNRRFNNVGIEFAQCAQVEECFSDLCDPPGGTFNTTCEIIDGVANGDVGAWFFR